MSERFTRKDAQAALERLSRALDLPLSTGHGVPGLVLEQVPCHRLYRIMQNDGHGYSQPFGATARSPRELVDTVSFLTDALTLAARKTTPEGSYWSQPYTVTATPRPHSHGGIEATLACPQCGPQCRAISALPDFSSITEQDES